MAEDAAVVGSPGRREIPVECSESLHLRLRFLQHTLGILMLHDSPIVPPSRHLDFVW